MEIRSTGASEPEVVVDVACDLGENPLWHPEEGRVYWTDIHRGRLHYYEPDTDRHEVCYRGELVGGFTIQRDGSLLLCGEEGRVRRWDNGSEEVVIDRMPEEEDCRINDVIADPEGRVFAGTMEMPGTGRLGRVYRIEPDGRYTKLLDDIDTSNGFGFTRDLEKMYFTESKPHKIHLFDYDRSSGEIDNQRLFVQTPPNGGDPDGLTVDAENYVWSARWDGSSLVRHAPDGTEVRSIWFPARKVSSVTFGGPDYRDMYVTTAGGENRPAEGPGAGSLFRLRLEGIQGIEEYRSAVGL